MEGESSIHGLEELILPKAAYTVNAIPINIPKIFFTLVKNSPEVYMEPQKNMK